MPEYECRLDLGDGGIFEGRVKGKAKHAAGKDKKSRDTHGSCRVPTGTCAAPRFPVHFNGVIGHAEVEIRRQEFITAPLKTISHRRYHSSANLEL